MVLPDDAAAALAARHGRLIATLAQAQFVRMLGLIRGGTEAREAIAQAQTGFSGAFFEQLSAAFSELLQRAVGVAEVKALPVGPISLSRRLYLNDVQTQAETLALVRQHAQGLHQARTLALRLYDGYDPATAAERPLEGRARAELPKALRALTADPVTRESLQALIKRGQAQAARLTSSALRAAYSEAFDAWAAGQGDAALTRRLDVAWREKNRFMAERIAQTELARAHQAQRAQELMADDSIEVVQVMLNPRHPVADICDLHGRANLWGLGPGCYPKERAPRPPFHPFCWCVLRSRPDLEASDARRAAGGEGAFLRSLPEGEAARVMGSRERVAAVLGGAAVDSVVNAGKDPLYRLQRLGDGAGHPLVGSAENAPVNRQQIEDFYFNRPGSPERVTIAALTDADRALFKTSARELWLSRASLDEHRAKHPEVGVDDYARIPELLRSGEVWAGPQDRRFVLLRIDGKPYRAALKVDASGKEAWFLSLIYNEKQKPPKGAVRIR